MHRTAVETEISKYGFSHHGREALRLTAPSSRTSTSRLLARFRPHCFSLRGNGGWHLIVPAQGGERAGLAVHGQSPLLARWKPDRLLGGSWAGSCCLPLVKSSWLPRWRRRGPSNPSFLQPSNPVCRRMEHTFSSRACWIRLPQSTAKVEWWNSLSRGKRRKRIWAGLLQRGGTDPTTSAGRAGVERRLASVHWPSSGDTTDLWQVRLYPQVAPGRGTGAKAIPSASDLGVKFTAWLFTLSVKFFQIPATPLTSACVRPSFPSFPITLATRVTSPRKDS
jgi:hypothetical protein